MVGLHGQQGYWCKLYLNQLTPEVWQRTFTEQLFCNYKCQTWGCKKEPNQSKEAFSICKSSYEWKIMNLHFAFLIFKNCQFRAKIGKPADTFVWHCLCSTNFQKKKSLCLFHLRLTYILVFPIKTGQEKNCWQTE